MIPKPIVSANIHFVAQDCFSHQLTHPATVVNLTRQCRPGFRSFSHHAKKPRMVLDLLDVPESFSRNSVRIDSTSFG